MSRTPPSDGDSNPIDNSDWSGTETKQLDIGRPDHVVATLYRYINGLDVDVDIDVKATDDIDGTSYSDTEDLRGGSGDASTLTVSSGTADSDFITEPWERLRVEVTPASNPSSGQFTLRAATQDEGRL